MTKSEVHGKRYEAEKASHGGHYTERDAETGQFTVSLSGEDLRLPERTSEKIAAETNTAGNCSEGGEKTRDIWDADTLFHALEVCEDERLKLAINLAPPST